MDVFSYVIWHAYIPIPMPIGVNNLDGGAIKKKKRSKMINFLCGFFVRWLQLINIPTYLPNFVVLVFLPNDLLVFAVRIGLLF